MIQLDDWQASRVATITPTVRVDGANEGGGSLATARIQQRDAPIRVQGVWRPRRPPSRLQRLRFERQLRLGGRETRIQQSLAALDAQPTIRLSVEEWASILDELRDEAP